MAALNENINRVISDFTAVKNAVESRGVTIEDNTPTSQYAQKILSIPDNTNTLRSLINGSLINLVIPENTDCKYRVYRRKRLFRQHRS